MKSFRKDFPADQGEGVTQDFTKVRKRILLR